MVQTTASPAVLLMHAGLFMYEPFATTLTEGVKSMKLPWRVEVRTTGWPTCSAREVEASVAALVPGSVFVWVGPFCGGVVKWRDLRQQKPSVLLVYWQTKMNPGCPSDYWAIHHDSNTSKTRTSKIHLNEPGDAGALIWYVDEVWEYSQATLERRSSPKSIAPPLSRYVPIAAVHTYDVLHPLAELRKLTFIGFNQFGSRKTCWLRLQELLATHAPGMSLVNVNDVHDWFA